MTKKKAKSEPKLAPSDAAMPTHDGTDVIDQEAQDGRAARMATMTPEHLARDTGQTATVSKKG